ncbi:MAG TPA: serine hydrolase domain-containing protein [Ktedonobacterales bacterium]|nr:serine hydrolase domain-containing protein [Ktedonobacterales bacterium]
MVTAAPRLESLDHIIQERIPPDGPGAAVAVIQGGQVIHSAGYGMASLEWSQPVGPDTVFGIGSTTKPFTATAIMLLERDGLLATAAPITDYLPDYDTHGATITLTHLLTHTSGIPNFITRPGFWERVAPLDHDHLQLRALFEPLPLDFAPGERYRYSNSGYCLLGMVIERVAGMPYADFVRERIFEPLGMASSGYLSRNRVIPRLAMGYEMEWRIAGFRPHVSETLVYSAGAIHSTVEDLARWDAALRDARLLDRETLARMERPLTLNDARHEGYGLGWGLSRFRGRPVVRHAGSVPGYSAFLGRFVEDDLTIIILSNWGLFDAARLLARPIAGLLLDLPEPPMPEHTPSIEASALARMAGSYANGIGDVVEFTVDGGRLSASGELTADLIPISDTAFRAAHDADITVSFEDMTASGYARAKIVVPFYWYYVYR